MLRGNAKVGLNTSNLPKEVVANFVKEKIIENVEQEIKDDTNPETSCRSAAPVVVVLPSESLKRLSVKITLKYAYALCSFAPLLGDTMRKITFQHVHYVEKK